MERKGYPLGLKGNHISLGARIFAVVDTFDAITSDRIYRRGRHYQDALEEILTFSGIQFDPIGRRCLYQYRTQQSGNACAASV